jgi:hypothetical protein
MPVLVLLCISLTLGAPSLSAAAADGRGANATVGPVNRLLGEEPTGSPSEADEERAVMEQLDKLRANPKERRRLIMIAQMFLGRFGYGVGPFDGRFDEKTRRAIKYYQESNKLSGTGELDYRTLKQLLQDADWLEQVPVQLPPAVFAGGGWDASVSASGTWTSANGREVMSLHTAHIECTRKWNSCVESTAMIGEGNQLILSMDHEEVERWDDQEIVAKPKERDCITETLRLSRSQKTATRVRTSTTSEPCRRSAGPDMTLRLDSGVTVWNNLDRVRKEGFRRIMKTGDFNLEEAKE